MFNSYSICDNISQYQDPKSYLTGVGLEETYFWLVLKFTSANTGKSYSYGEFHNKLINMSIFFLSKINNSIKYFKFPTLSNDKLEPSLYSKY